VTELKRKARGYSEAFATAQTLGSTQNRAGKACKIAAVLRAEGGLQTRRERVLDVGCSHGHILAALAPLAGHCVGVDLDLAAMRQGARGPSFVAADVERLPFPARSFDVVVCNHVYEHTVNAAALLAEIRRVLRQDGVCYFAGPNRYSPIEPHYGLPLLSWLPRPLADHRRPPPVYPAQPRPGAAAAPAPVAP